MASIIGTVGEFQSREDTWDNYVARVNQFFVANDITDDNKKKAILLTSVGARTYKLICSLTQPVEPATKTFAEIVTVVKEHQSPKPSMIVQRFKFNSRVRKADESVRNYVAELRKLSEHCEYNDQLEDMLRDRLVCGIGNVQIQTKLLSEKSLTFKKAFDMAVAMETASENSKSISNMSMTSQSQGASVNVLHKGKFKSSSFKNDKSGRSGGCFRCGNKHNPDQCKYKESTCFGCGKVGHPKFNCRSSTDKKQSDHVKFSESKKRAERKQNRNYDLSETDFSEDFYNLFSMSESDNKSESSRSSVVIQKEPLITKLLINGQSLDFQVDTGAALTVMSHEVYDKHFKEPLLHCNKTLKTYTGEEVSIVGETNVEVCSTIEGNKKVLPLLVLENKGPNLLGRNWLTDIQIDWSMFMFKNNDCTHLLSSIIEEFDEVFNDNPGVLKNVTVDFNIDVEEKPIFHKARQPPYSMRAGIEDELERLQREGIIEKVKFSKWATPIVPVMKTDGSIRICGDYKNTLNKVAHLDNHPIPLIEDMANQLATGEKFTKLDFSHAYTQLKLSEEAKQYTTINTHKGLFRYNRLCYGIASAPAIFQRTLEQLFSELDSVKNYIDDLYITGRNDEEHIENLRKVLEICRQNGLTIRKSKCEFMKEAVYFLGYKLSKNGLQPVDEKVRAVKDFPDPQDKNQVRSFLGLINYYGKFTNNLSVILKPLYDLLKKNKQFTWGKEEKEAFALSKAALLSDKVLAHFNPNLKTIITCDGSPYGVGAILSQIDDEGIEKPVCYASKTLSKAEQNYSQTDREGLSVIFAVKKWHKYIWGRPVQIRTDHKPLLGLLGKGVPEQASARVQRWATLMSAYAYELVYVPGTANVADILSRLPVSVGSSPENVLPEIHSLFQFIENSPIKVMDIARDTADDPILSKVLLKVKHGWKEADKTDLTLKAYYVRKDELSIDNDCVLWGVRVIIPTKLRKSVMQLLHDTHIGSARMKAQARAWVWWPNMDSEIESTVRACHICQVHSNKPSKAPLFPWTWPEEPWYRVHLDFAGPFLGKMFLIITDAHSKWLEVRIMAKITASDTIQELREVFSILGLCHEIVTDNGPTFTSIEFQKFMTHNGIKHITVSPYHPASNGLAERNVQTFKQAMIKNEKGTIRERVSRFLTRYRALPHSTTGLSPSELLLGRKMRTHLDLLHPSLISKVAMQQESQKRGHDRISREREFMVGDQVLSQNFSARGENWIPGMIIEKTGPYSFKIKTQLGIWRRHVDQIKKLITDDSVEIQGSETLDKDSIEENRSSEIGSKHVNLETRPLTETSQETIEQTPILPEVEKEPVVQEQDIEVKLTPDDNESPIPLRRSNRIKLPVIKLNLYLQ